MGIVRKAAVGFCLDRPAAGIVGVVIMSAPSFTVIVPCYNTQQTVAETLDSVLAQTDQDFEIVAVDNNSTDGTRAILEKYAARDARIRVVNEPVQGLAAARNGGIRAARGRMIALLDADDTFDVDYLYAHRRNIERNGADISYARLRYVDMAGRPTGQETRPPLSGLGPVDLLISNPCTAMIVVRREVFDKAGLFDIGMRRVEDQEWIFRALISGASTKGIDRTLANYRITPGGLSSDVEAMLASHQVMLERASRIAPRLVERHRSHAEAAMLRYCARRAREHGHNASTARSYMWRMLVTDCSILIREPKTTLNAMAATLVPRLVTVARAGWQRMHPSGA
jgi:glycosyltransferase involved in cell wall biosynthesis